VVEVEGVEGCYLLKSLYVRGTRGMLSMLKLAGSCDRNVRKGISLGEPRASDEPGRRPAVSYRTTSNLEGSSLESQDPRPFMEPLRLRSVIGSVSFPFSPFRLDMLDMLDILDILDTFIP
jgi:hypothetical protein